MSTIERMTSRDLSAIRSIETRFLSQVKSLVLSVLRASRNRRAMLCLHDLEDHQLRDIGLTRADVDRAVNRSGLLDDPFALLPKDVQLRRRRFAVLPQRF